MKIPTAIKVFEVGYPIKYFATPIEVDLEGKEELASQWDVQDGVIRIHHGERPWKAVTQSLWTIILEIICKHMIIEFGQREETVVERLAVGLNTIQFYIKSKEELADEEEGGKGTKLVDEEKEK